METERDSFAAMRAAVQAFHDKHDFASNGGEALHYRVALMAEELGEISAAITKGRPVEEIADECADLLILLIGTDISADFDLSAAFWKKMAALMQRPARTVRDHVRVSASFGDEG